MRDDTPTLVFHNKLVNKKIKNKYMVSGSLKFSLNHFGDEA